MEEELNLPLEPKRQIYQLSDKCPECGAIAKEKFRTNPTLLYFFSIM